MDKLPNYKKVIDSDYQAQANVYSVDNELYGFFNAQYAPNGSVNLKETATSVRKDVLDDNGLSIPSTLDELYEVAKALKQAYPYKYPLERFQSYMGLEDVIYYSYFVESGRYWDGEIYVYGATQDGYKKALQYLNKLYTEKIDFS